MLRFQIGLLLSFLSLIHPDLTGLKFNGGRICGLYTGFVRDDAIEGTAHKDLSISFMVLDDLNNKDAVW